MRLFFYITFLLSGVGAQAQSEQLARHYFEQGEFVKALHHYEKLWGERPQDSNVFSGLISSHQQLEQYAEAEKLLLQRLNSTANLPTLLVELGHNYDLQRDSEKAGRYYKEALLSIESRPNFAYAIAKAFEKYSLLDNAIEAYETGMRFNPSSDYNIHLARLYGEKGQLEKMFDSYFQLLEKTPQFLPSLYQHFGQFITEDSSNEANTIFRRLLLTRLQQDPDILYNEMLSWLFVQQAEYEKSFLQEKAIYRRGEGNLARLMQLSNLAGEDSPEIATEILDFIIAESPSAKIRLQAHQLKLHLAQRTDLTKEKIEQEYRTLLTEFGSGIGTLGLQIDFANFLAFTQGKKEEAHGILKSLLGQNSNEFEAAAVKMALGDILVLDEKFNQALIYYTQVQQAIKNDVLAQEARFKIAKTSYYKGDFQWASTQLDVLKTATSQLIANDALEMSLLISDNRTEDSTQAALAEYARADLLSFQGKNEEAIEALEQVLQQYKGQKIEDEALLKQAELLEQEGQYSKAASNYHTIINYHRTGILGDNAHYRLAELYAGPLGDPEKAKEFYEKIIFDYADSIYFVDARTKYRQLRGENLE